MWVPGVPAGCSRAPWQPSAPGAGRLWVLSARGCQVLRVPGALGCLVLAGALAAWRSGCPAPSGAHCSRALVNIMAINHVLDRCACTPAHCSHGTLVCTAPGGGPRPRGKSCAMVRRPWSWHTPLATRCSPASTRRSRPHFISLLLTDFQGVRPRGDIQRPLSAPWRGCRSGIYSDRVALRRLPGNRGVGMTLLRRSWRARAQRGDVQVSHMWNTMDDLDLHVCGCRFARSGMQGPLALKLELVARSARDRAGPLTAPIAAWTEWV